MSKILFEEKKFGYKLTVLENRIEWSMWGSKTIIPFGNISDIQRPAPFANKINLMLNNGKTIALYPKKVDLFLEVVGDLISNKATT